MVEEEGGWVGIKGENDFTFRCAWFEVKVESSGESGHKRKRRLKFMAGLNAKDVN